jgi:hypothetical protein
MFPISIPFTIDPNQVMNLVRTWDTAESVWQGPVRDTAESVWKGPVRDTAQIGHFWVPLPVLVHNSSLNS